MTYSEAAWDIAQTLPWVRSCRAQFHPLTLTEYPNVHDPIFTTIDVSCPICKRTVDVTPCQMREDP